LIRFANGLRSPQAWGSASRPLALTLFIALAFYGGWRLFDQRRTRTLQLCVLTDFQYRSERPDWQVGLQALFKEVNRLFAKTGIAWHVAVTGEAYPPETGGSMSERLSRMAESATCHADVVLGLTGQADKDTNTVALPFSHALMVSDSAANSSAMTAIVLSRSLAELFGAPVSSRTLIAFDTSDGEIFDENTVDLIHSMRDYDFSAGIQALPGKWEKQAATAISKAVASRNQHPVAESHAILARSFTGNRRYEDASRAYRAAVQNDPQNPNLRFEFAMALEAASESEQALKELRMATQLNADDALPHAAMGAIYLNSGRVDAAIVEFSAASHLEPQKASYRTALGAALAHRPGSVKEAEEAFHTALKLKPSEPGALSGLLAQQNTEQLYENAVRQSETAAHGEVASVDSHLRIGITSALAGNLERARAEIRRAIDMDPSSGAAHLAMARVLYLSGMYESANSELHAARDAGVQIPAPLREALDRRLGKRSEE
jgi:tetratricopeptide (TPR) repeat protein